MGCEKNKEIEKSCAEMDFEWEKHLVSKAMYEHGGSFAKALGKALAHADPNNARKIKATWRGYWKRYLIIGAEQQRNTILKRL